MAELAQISVADSLVSSAALPKSDVYLSVPDKELNVFSRYARSIGRPPTEDERESLRENLREWMSAFKKVIFHDPLVTSYILRESERAIGGKRGCGTLVDLEDRQKLVDCFKDGSAYFGRLLDVHTRRRELGQALADKLMASTSDDLAAVLGKCPLRFTFLLKAADYVRALRLDHGRAGSTTNSNETTQRDFARRLPYSAGRDLIATQDELEDLLAERAKLNNLLVEQSLGLVIDIARSFNYRLVYQTVSDRWDLIQEGNLALLRAAELYDPEDNANFATYARACVEWRLRAGLAKWRSALDATNNLTGLSRLYYRTKDKLAQDLGRSPSQDEIRAVIGESEYSAAVAAVKAKELDSIDDPGPDEDMNRWERIPDRRGVDPERELMRSELEQTARALLSKKSPQHQKLACDHFGISLADDPTLQALSSEPRRPNPGSIARELNDFVARLRRDPEVRKRLEPYTYLLSGTNG